jgi:4-aminobutyrate aminotransferase
MLSGHSTQSDAMAANVTKVPYPYCYRCPWERTDPETCGLPCLRFLQEQVLRTVSPAHDTAGVILEAIQSDNGDVVAPDAYLRGLRETCDEHGIWLVFDEVKTGLGRTGTMFAFEHAGIVADAISLGKPLGGGLPVSAVVGRKELLDAPVFDLFTLGGSPAPCAGGIATLDVIERDGLVDRARIMGDLLLEGLRDLQERHPTVGDVRGRGLIAGLELVEDRATRAPAREKAAQLVYRCFELGLLVIYTGILANVVEFTPALTIAEADVHSAVSILDEALADVEAGRFDDGKLSRFRGW